MKHLLSTTILLTIMLGISCHKDNGPCLTCPPPYVQSIVLDTLSVEPTAVLLQVHTTDSTHLGVVELYRDSVSVFSMTILGIDTTIIDTSLLPYHRYRYKAFRLNGTNRSDSSAPLFLTTMDTTSHNFAWEIGTLGDGNSSMLNDVAIVNDTLVYAVGEIYKKDSLGRFDPEPYALAMRDGRTWRLTKVPYHDYGTVQTLPGPLNTILAFSATDIFVSSSANLLHWDGQGWEEKAFLMTSVPFNGQVLKMWGTSGSDLYLVGRGGAIYHYDGYSWQKQESGTTVDLLDIWGTPDGSIVWSCGYNSSQAGTCLLRNQGSGWQLAYDGTPTEQMVLVDSLSGAFTGVYAKGDMRVYVGSDAGIYQCPTTTRGQGKRLSFSPDWFPGFPNALRGTGVNDLFIVGEYFMVAHYNGADFRYYSELSGNGRWKAVTEKGNLVVAVGYTYDSINSRGIVLRGTR